MSTIGSASAVHAALHQREDSRALLLQPGVADPQPAARPRPHRQEHRRVSSSLIWQVFFSIRPLFFCLSLNRSINVEYDKMI